MKIIDNLEELEEILDNLRKKNKKIGLIPTMGSIHKGHLSLIENAKKMKCFSINTIFINPTQFDDSKDFKKYPKNKAKDIFNLRATNCVGSLCTAASAVLCLSPAAERSSHASQRCKP